MPIVRIDIEAGKPIEYRRALLGCVRRGITTALNVPNARVTQRIVETPAENIDNPEEKSERYTVVEISMLPGRGPELKERLYAAIAEQLARELGVAESDLVVLVRDPEEECFFLNGAMATPAPARDTADSEEVGP